MKRMVIITILLGCLLMALCSTRVAGTATEYLVSATLEASDTVQHNAGNTPADIAERIKALNSSNPVERASAACRLAKTGARSVDVIPLLIRLLSDDSPVTLIQCDEGEPRSAGDKGFEKTSPGEQAAVALAAMGKPAVDPLIAILTAGEWRVRANASFAMGLLRDHRTVEPLIAVLKDKDGRVREKAAWGLGLKSNALVVEPLITALQDTEWQVRRQSAWALGLQGDRRSVEPLIAALKDERREIREQAAWALGLKGDGRAVEPLILALKDQDWQVRRQAAWALGLKGDEQSVAPLITALKDAQWEVREQAAWALGLRDDETAVDALKTALKDEEKGVRKQAEWALQLIGMKFHPEQNLKVKVKAN